MNPVSTPNLKAFAEQVPKTRVGLLRALWSTIHDCLTVGHSLREIATEKAGILKPGVPLVLAKQPPEARDVILARAKSLGCEIIEPAQVFRIDGESMEQGSARARIASPSGPRVMKRSPIQLSVLCWWEE